MQNNHSQSVKNVLRGVHCQVPAKVQGKFARVVQGESFEMAVNLRKSSPTFWQWVGEILSSENKHQVLVPEGFAHSFVALLDSVECLYKTTDYYSPEHERCIVWTDKNLAIKWPIHDEPLLSQKDAQGNPFREAELFP